MSRTYGWLVALLAAVPLAGSCFAQDGLLKYDDDQADGRRSTAQAGYITVFDAPEGMPVLKSVSINASQYGRQDPRDFVVAVTDMDLKPMVVFGYSYDLLPYGGAPQWVELPLPEEVKPPAKFAVAVYCHCLQDRGVFVGLDVPANGKSQSYTALPGADAAPQPDVDGKPANWMIRCQMAKGFEKPHGAATQLRYDNGTFEEMQSMGGTGQVVQFTVPEEGGPFTLKRVLVCGGYYGQPGTDGESNQGHLAICTADGTILSQQVFRYDEFYWSSTPCWTSIPLATPVEVTDDIYVITDMNSRPTPGIYVGYDTEGDACHSQIGAPGSTKTWTPRNADPQKSNWCIRVQLERKPEAPNPDETGGPPATELR